MNLNNLTIKSQEVIQEAQQIALTSEQQAIEPAHILKAMMNVDENVIPFILKKVGVNPEMIQSGIDNIIKSYPRASGANQYLSDESNKVVQKALAFMRAFGDEYISIKHLLMGMILGKDKTSQLHFPSWWCVTDSSSGWCDRRIKKRM